MIDRQHLPQKLLFFTKCPGIKSQKDAGMKNSLVLLTLVFKCDTHLNMINKNNWSPQGNRRKAQANVSVL